VSISSALGEQHTAAIPAGTIAYRERGAGDPIVFVHGVGVNGDLWRKVVPALTREHRCIAPDLPLGAHSHPLDPNADLSLPGLAKIVADFIEAVSPGQPVTVVANDTGGAVAQALVGDHPDRVARLVLTSCDAFEKFPPRPQLYLKPAARIPPLLHLVARAVRYKPVQRTPTAYGWTTKRPMPAEIMRSYTDPIRANPGVRKDLERLLRAVDTRYTFEAADKLRAFDKPAIVLWAADDKLFPRDHGRRLAELLPQASFELIDDSRTFIPEEQPDKLAAAIERFLAGTSP
jgi:pimeloyl-ACP methyl ester carboxylesterase